jgi:hypothetical protein
MSQKSTSAFTVVRGEKIKTPVTKKSVITQTDNATNTMVMHYFNLGPFQSQLINDRKRLNNYNISSEPPNSMLNSFY